MVKHIVMWKLKDFAEGLSREANLIRMKDELLGLKSKLPQIVDMEIGEDFVRSPASADIILVTTFISKADLDAYRIHPEHVTVAEFIGKITSERMVVDFETNPA